jgi:hypothetical protein
MPTTRNSKDCRCVCPVNHQTSIGFGSSHTDTSLILVQFQGDLLQEVKSVMSQAGCVPLMRVKALSTEFNEDTVGMTIATDLEFQSCVAITATIGLSHNHLFSAVILRVRVTM